MMTRDTALQPVASAAIAGDDAPPSAGTPRAKLARRILGHALLLGIVADALLRDGPVGAGLVIWVALLVLATAAVAKFARRPLRLESMAWLATSLLFAAATTWRASDELEFFNFVAVVLAIALAGVALARRGSGVFAARLRETFAAWASVARHTAVGAIPLAFRDAGEGDSARRPPGTLGTGARVVGISAAVLLVFGALLRSADPIFASFVRIPPIDAATVASHVVIVGFFGVIVAGWARAAFIAEPPRAAPPDSRFVRLGRAEVTSALGTLLVLFALFVLAQLGWLFGGERFLRERTGLTAAEYARRGFFQLTAVLVLVVPVLVLTRVALDPKQEPALRRRHTALSLPIIGLLALMVASAFLRMRLYVSYFGLTTDRLYPLVAMAWLVFVLIWLAGTALRDRWRAFAAGVVISGFAALAALDVVAPDMLVARVDIRRAAMNRATAIPLDVSYLSTLGGDAAALATEATLAARAQPDGAANDTGRCDAARRLLRRWGPESRIARRIEEPASWRTWNFGEREAVHVVAANARSLRAAAHEACSRTHSGDPTPRD